MAFFATITDRKTNVAFFTTPRIKSALIPVLFVDKKEFM